MSQLCKLSHNKDVLGNFREFISQERLIGMIYDLIRMTIKFKFKLFSKPILKWKGYNFKFRQFEG